MENLKEALQYVVGLGNKAEKRGCGDLRKNLCEPEPDPLRLHGQGKGNYRRHSVVSRGLYKRLQQ